MATLTEIIYMAKILPKTKSIMLRGPHGCGKTEWTQNVLGKELGLDKVVIWHPSHAADTGDITGLPEKQTLSDGSVVTKFCPPDWMVQNEPVLLIIDEANRGLAMVQNAIMQLTASSTYGNTSLPAGSRIIGLINPEIDDGDISYDVGSMDAAQQDRFVYIDFEPTVDEWLEYATKANLNQRVIDYINDHPEQLDFELFKNQELVKSALNSKSKRLPSRRSWKAVADMLDKAEADNALSDQFKTKCVMLSIAGLVGDCNAINFADYLKAGRALSAKQILLATEFDNKWHDEINKMKTAAAKQFYTSMQLLLKNMTFDDLNETKRIANNFNAAISSFEPDILRNIVQVDIATSLKNEESWIKSMFSSQPALKTLYIQTITGSSDKQRIEE